MPLHDLTSSLVLAQSPGGLTGFVLDVVDALGAWGVGFLCFLEVVFPPIPSELVLPLAGYQVERGSIGLVAVIVASTLGSLLGALLLYWVGRKVGLERAARFAERVPLMEGSDVLRSGAWFDRHSKGAVFTGRFVPGIRSLVSLPAGAARMPLLWFGALTLLGSGVWNSALILLGVALGTQYELVERYGAYLDYVAYGSIALLVGLGVVRRVKRRRESMTSSA